jgi:hypothetical protein
MPKTQYDIPSEEGDRGGLSWTEVSALIAVLLALATGAKAWFWNEWRLDNIEREHLEVRQTIQKNSETLSNIEADLRVIRLYLQGKVSTLKEQ